MMDQCATPAPSRAEAMSQHADYGCEIALRQIPIRPSAPDESQQFILFPIARRDLRHDLLRQNIERLVWYGETVKLASADAVEQRRALNQFIA
jgi:hypothetical protein